ncbi:MAG: PIN domain-containing protein [Verrucomicrobia bacterium]|nr:PIN domain-containing protein [Verrucomicrobiota bacterium]
MIGIDANVLVALAVKEHPSHSQAVSVFDRELTANEEVVLSPSVAAEFLHVVTDPRRITPAQEMTAAIFWLRAWATEVAPVWLTPNDAAIELWLKWMAEFRLGRKRILDTQYAALLHTHNVRRLLTNNADDFRVFGVFELVSF